MVTDSHYFSGVSESIAEEMRPVATIVLAEDDTDIRDVTTRLLRRAGHTVLQAVDGAAAWQAIEEHQPDIVLSDIEMPVMTGVDLCQQIRADSRTRHLPVVFVSGSLIPGDRRPEQAEATAVICKPFRAGDLTSCVEKALRHGHTAGQKPSIC
jgi:CheY-like chemotaxis protein